MDHEKRRVVQYEREAQARYNSINQDGYPDLESEYQDTSGFDIYRSEFNYPDLKRRESRPRLFEACVKSAIVSGAVNGLIPFERAEWVISLGGLVHA